jgi:hypothetical protein
VLNERKRGVCPDSEVGGSDGIQVLEGRRVGPLTVIKFRRQLKKADDKDKDYDVDKVRFLLILVKVN